MTKDEDETTFERLGLSEASLETVKALGFQRPSKIQTAFIPVALTGVDCSGQARTGTGKTAAFALPMLERLDLSKSGVLGLVLAPTRELSEQVAGEVERLSNGRAKTVIVVGGRPMGPQVTAIRRGAQIVIGTPGRIIDLLRRGELTFDRTEIVVLDEADRMLDEGFRPDIERILKRCPEKRQTLLLSATMPPEVEQLASKFMRNPERVDMSQDALVASDMIEQFVITVDSDRKFSLLTRVLVQERPRQALVFCRTKRGADQLYKKFQGKLDKVAIMHGDLPQPKRDKVLAAFRAGKTRLLIATDVVGRGIDISGISHIINYDVPEYCDDYVHRIGRTGRLSSASRGRAITFVTREQGDQLTKIEIRVNKLLPTYEVDDFEAARPREKKRRLEDAAPARQRSSIYAYG
ncbi:MAG: DEAD/DEAH box helicase [Planctomycetaceae bacterium]